MGVGFSTSVFRQTELSKDPARLNIGLTYKRMDTRGACWVVSDFNTLQCSVYVGGGEEDSIIALRWAIKSRCGSLTTGRKIACPP